jgi:hypothetical protein
MIADRVKETTTTTGTGSLTLAGAAAQFQSFNTAFGTGTSFYYAITDANGADWEIGTGELSNATTLVRTTVHQSSNADAKINLSSGTHTVFNTAPETFLTGLATKAGKLSQFGATTSAELAGVISDETGSGSLVFANSPTLVTPNLGTPSAITLTNASGTASININGTVGATTPNSGAFTTLSASGVATFSAGSAAAPAITTTGDTNTGEFFPSADIIGWTTGGTERMRLDTVGRLGVGIAPGYRLDVLQSDVSAPATRIASGNTSTGGQFTYNEALRIQNTSNTNNNWAAVGFYDSANAIVATIGAQISDHTAHSGSLAFGTRNGGSYAERVRITADGLVTFGGGTTSSFPALKRSSTTLQVRLADDSAFAPLEGDSITLNNTGAALVMTGGNPGIRQNGSSGGTLYFDVATGGATHGAFVWRSSSAFTERLRIDTSGNLGLGVTPSAWEAGNKAIDFGGSSAIWQGVAGQNAILRNAYYNGTSWIYKTTAAASRFNQSADGSFFWSTAPSGTAGNAISFTQAMTLDASGNLGVGVTSPSYRLDVSGQARFSNTIFSTVNGGTAALDLSVGTAAGRAVHIGTTGSDAYIATASSTGGTLVTGSPAYALELRNDTGFVFGTGSSFALGIKAGGFMQFAGTTSSFPALKRSSTTLQVRLADDSGDAPLSCAALTASGVATFTAGSASAPAITTSGDTNNGIFFPAADVTAITTAGTERVRVDASGNFTFKNGIIENVYTITDGVAFEIDPTNGTVQLITLGANRTPKGTNFAAGESCTLMVDDGTAYTLTWTDTTFGTSGVTWVGGTAPTLATTGYTVIELWKVSTQVYAAYVGNVA